MFYPRYFEMINQVVEDWFAGPLGQDFRSLHEGLNIGVPTVSIECEFTHPSRLGDRLILDSASNGSEGVVLPWTS